PAHPYALAGSRALSDGIALFMSWVAAAGLHWQGTLDHNLTLPTAIGTPKPSCLVPASMARGDLKKPEPIVFCGFNRYEDFVPELAAGTLRRSWQRTTVGAIRVDVPNVKPGDLLTSIDLARWFEDPAFRRQMVTQIRSRIGADRLRLGMPAVLGMTHADEVHRAFEEELGLPVFEVPTLPPSMPGLRLFDRLRKHLQETGVELIQNAPAHAAEVRDGRCLRIQIRSAGGDRPVEARAFILALEDTVDGALRAGVHTMQDPFFHQALGYSAIPSQRADESLFKPQPFARIGYRVTDRLQPADPEGRPLANNVFIAGGAIAGYDPAPTKSRGGLAIATGYRAAQEAMAA
ncbi:MAG TPA: anaerobic glycerol-3-phosphate dehydrogenase subunit B, partial [Candidatus Dormibacteraeota bacterium]